MAFEGGARLCKYCISYKNTDEDEKSKSKKKEGCFFILFHAFLTKFKI